ncbi:hypothetical protein [Micropruina sp.]|uniref:hypothetical protein n=1 Tax=Micropruina sp. TaxID=2737536 RepID=UPI0026368A85|nr:hypothetical protein [Micropruina sp.]
MGLFDRAGLPSADFRSLIAAVGRRVRVLAWAQGGDGPVVGLAGQLAIQQPDGWRFVPWHEIASGGWDSDSGRLRWRLTDGSDGEVLLRDPGSLPDLFRERVDASIVVQERFELNRGRAAMIVARRPLDDEHAALLWTVTRHGGSFDTAQIDQADAELARLRAEYDIA